MTVFDVIKYPISNPPSREEIDNLPDHIFNKWLMYARNAFNPTYTHQHIIKSTNELIMNKSFDCRNYMYYILLFPHKSTGRKECIDYLKKLLRENEV